jgi:integrase
MPQMRHFGVPLVSRMHFTDLALTKLPLGPRRSYWDDSLPTFGMRVGQRTKTFVIKQNNRYHVIGRYPAVTLKQAREEARRRIALRYFPQQSVNDVPTGKAIDLYLRSQSLRPTSLNLYARTLENHFPPHKSLHQLTLHDLSAKLRALPPAHANVAHSIFKAFLNWCVRETYISSNPLTHLKRPHKTRARERLLTDQEINLVWRESYNHVAFGEIVRSLVLSGARLNQIARFNHAWIQGDTIVFPASIMKSNEQMTLPLSGALRRNLPKSSRASANFSDAMKKLRVALEIPHFTLHDFRRYFSSTMAKLGVPIDITEALLSHKTGSRSPIQRTYDVYSRIDPMRKALTMYEQHLSTFCDGLNISEPQ